MVVLLCNLKPAKMRGIVSEAMVMCASTPEKVEILAPPAGAVPGDLVKVPGFEGLLLILRKAEDHASRLQPHADSYLFEPSLGKA